jgi:hypothetical protein
MGVARGLERRLERLVDGLASRLFRGRVHPLELGTMLVREADLALVDTAAGPTAPNVYRITMGGDPVDGAAVTTAATELAGFVDAAAADRGWRLEGPARVDVVVDPDLRSSEVAIVTGFEPGEMEPWALLDPLDPGAPVRRVSHIRSVVGRSADSDVRVAGDTVSRIHALIWQEAGAAWVCDLESSNGTFLNGERLAEPAAIVEGDILMFGDVGFTVRVP